VRIFRKLAQIHQLRGLVAEVERLPAPLARELLRIARGDRDKSRAGAFLPAGEVHAPDGAQPDEADFQHARYLISAHAVAAFASCASSRPKALRTPRAMTLLPSSFMWTPSAVSTFWPGLFSALMHSWNIAL